MERWKKNLYILWVTQVISMISFGLAVPFLPLYIRELGVESAEALNYWTGMMSFVPAFTMAVAAPIWGIASDLYGRKMMLLRAMVAAAIMLTLMGLVQNEWQLLGLRALQGIFTGTITASMAFVAANTPENKLSFALGFLTSSNFIGYSLGPIFGGLLSEVLGYRVCFILGGATMIVGFFLTLFVLVEDKTTYGPQLRSNKEGKPKEKIPMMKLFTYFVVMMLSVLLLNRLSRSAFTPFVSIFVEDVTGATAGAATWTGIINGVNGVLGAISALTISRLGDKYDKLKILLIISVISLPVAILAAQVKSLGIFIFVFGLYYFFTGGIEPLLSSSISENTSPQVRGTIFGFIGMVGSLGMMVAPVMASIISAKWSVHGILYIIPVFLIIQVGMLVGILRRKTRKNVGVVKK